MQGFPVGDDVGAYVPPNMPQGMVSSPSFVSYTPSLERTPAIPATFMPMDVTTPRLRSPPLSGISSPRTDWRLSRDSLVQPSLPYTKEFLDDYRRRMQNVTDPEPQMEFATYLIDAGKRICESDSQSKQARKQRDALVAEGLRLIKKLATSGSGPGKPPYADAQFFLANCYGNGTLGMPIDHAKSYRLYVQASKQNHPAATYRTAVCNEVGAGTKRNFQRGVLFYRKAASLGDTAGMYKLGMVLLYGLLDQPANPREAIVWLRRAASQADEDNPHALYELATHHADPSNRFVPYNEALARDLYTQAARLGHAPSQCKLGDAYANGTLACPVDPRSSVAWFNKAANKGEGQAELALSGWYLTGAEGVLMQSDSEAYTWARRAANKGIANAEYAVGHYSEVGIGTPVNLDEALRWYTRAAAKQHPRAIQRVQDLKASNGRAPLKVPDADCVVM